MFHNRVTDLQIKHLKAQRKKAVDAFYNLSRLKNEELADYFYCTYKTGQDVPYELLSALPVGYVVSLPVVRGGSVEIVKIEPTDRDILRFNTKWQAGSTLTWHYHSNANELLRVIKGSLYVYRGNEKLTILEGQVLEISSNVEHQLTALEDLELQVDYLKV